MAGYPTLICECWMPAPGPATGRIPYADPGPRIPTRRRMPKLRRALEARPHLPEVQSVPGPAHLFVRRMSACGNPRTQIASPGQSQYRPLRVAKSATKPGQKGYHGTRPLGAAERFARGDLEANSAERTPANPSCRERAPRAHHDKTPKASAGVELARIMHDFRLGTETSCQH
jgi:hypothetical protein